MRKSIRDTAAEEEEDIDRTYKDEADESGSEQRKKPRQGKGKGRGRGRGRARGERAGKDNSKKDADSAAAALEKLPTKESSNATGSIPSHPLPSELDKAAVVANDLATEDVNDASHAKQAGNADVEIAEGDSKAKQHSRKRKTAQPTPKATAAKTTEETAPAVANPGGTEGDEGPPPTDKDEDKAQDSEPNTAECTPEKKKKRDKSQTPKKKTPKTTPKRRRKKKSQDYIAT